MNKTRFLHAPPKSTRGTTLRIAETFVSRQGEGILTGTDSFFIRTSGCNLRCWFCDTPYASWNPEGESRTIDSLVRAVKEADLKHVILTGGEPLLAPQSTLLVESLQEAGHHVTIETAGTIDRDVRCDLLSLSPKFASSAPDQKGHPDWHDRHHRRRMPIEIMRKLLSQSLDYQVKYVVNEPSDLPEVMTLTAELDIPADKVWIMPQGITPEELDATSIWLSDWTRNEGFNECDRMHIRWYGNRRGT
ncbi:7-carboxy-7-deazaguanine synthase [Novipirellula aureliae]|uniref:7-carboxy-7-deazaguanine synthase n=1 Tax=Novipirellula aureliae TaxID=2527966 RepID=A0A5C6DYG4_9BACT|nr:7-carboxy-7-deazaguanine synthase QueE [Novipirellula aureliae]TWU41668.1 7-carboxy-7-deazaguanine synthase [Novipirellula aureliae]